MNDKNVSEECDAGGREVEAFGLLARPRHIRETRDVEECNSFAPYYHTRETRDTSFLSPHIHEECGVLGIYLPEKDALPYYLSAGLCALQHRGQESCGMVVDRDGLFYSHKNQDRKRSCRERV